MAETATFAGKTAPHVVLSWGNHPGHMPPPQFSPNQTTFCAGSPERGLRFDATRHVVHGWTGNPAPDLSEALRTAGRPTDVDLIVVATDGIKSNRILGLDAFQCPKLLLAGDTHHAPRTLEVLLAYARSQHFDAIAIQFDLHHAHWFRAAGFRRIAWAPGLIANLVTLEGRNARPGIVGMIGQSGGLFPRRARLLQGMRDAGVPVFRFTASHAQFDQVMQSLPIAFNCSLNGDLNLRNFEATSAGSMLLTDRLSPQSGFSRLFEPGRECVLYDTEEELVELCRHYLAHPSEAASIAERGRRRIAATPALARQAEALVRWVLDDAPAPFPFEDDRRTAASMNHAARIAERLTAYQAAQLVHAERERPRAYIGEGFPGIAAVDLADLPRLGIAVHERNGDALSLVAACGLASRVETVRNAKPDPSWDLWLDAGALHGPTPTVAGGLVAMNRAGADDIEALNQEAALRYRREIRLATEPHDAVGHSITSISGPHGQLRLIVRRAPSSSDLLKQTFEERRYLPYPGIGTARTIVDIGAGQGIVAAFFRLAFPDAALLCFEDDPDATRFLVANAAALGNCRVQSERILTDGRLASAPRASIESVAMAGGIDILRIATPGTTAVLDGIAAILPRTKSMFIAGVSPADRPAIAVCLEKTHVGWLPDLHDSQPEPMRFVRRDLLPTAPGGQT